MKIKNSRIDNYLFKALVLQLFGRNNLNFFQAIVITGNLIPGSHIGLISYICTFFSNKQILMHFLERFKLIKTFVFDMDGVLTDGGLHIHGEGEWIRRMNVRDGYALQLAVKSGFRIVVISGSHSEPVAARLKKLGVQDVFMRVTQKAAFLMEFAATNDLSPGEMLFMGDDIPDAACLQMVGLACCPADAAPEIIQICRYVSPYKGGFGCVRDVIEKVLKLNNKWFLQTSVPST